MCASAILPVRVGSSPVTSVCGSCDPCSNSMSIPKRNCSRSNRSQSTPISSPTRRASSAVVRLLSGIGRVVRRASGARRRSCADRLVRCLEERLVDLPVVDRNAFLDADADDLFAVDPHLLGELVGRQVVGHSVLLRVLGLEPQKSPPAQGTQPGSRSLPLECGSPGPLRSNIHSLAAYSGPDGPSNDPVPLPGSGCGAAW